MEKGQQQIREGYVNWRNRAAVRGRHGGMAAAAFVLVVEILENMAYLANASNLVTYLAKEMHLSPARSANNVTNFMGTAFLLALLGGFLSDAFFSAYLVYLISAAIEFLGLVILTVQARSSLLKPPECNKSNPNIKCEEVSGAKAAFLYTGLYLVALGVGGIKGALATHGAEQFDESLPKGRKHRSTFFNYFVFCLSCGALIAVTFVVWVEDNKGWEWGFGLSTIAIFLSIPIFLAGSAKYRNKIPTGSPLTTIAKVLTAAALTRTGPSNAVASLATSPFNATEERRGQEPKSNQKDSEPVDEVTQSISCLNRAVAKRPASEVEDVKVVIRILPIFACTVMLNCCLAQLSSFSVEQASTMDTKLGSLKVPPASLPVFPVVFIMILAPIYDHLIIPFARKATKSETGISHLQRIGIGLVLSILAMAVAAVVEIKRKRVATKSGMLDSKESLPITFLWIAFQYLFLGSADLFTLAGLLEFFFTEAPASMRSLATSLSWASLAMGYYLSSVIVSVVNHITENYGSKPWLDGPNINYYYLERFYWLMCALSAVNFLHYLFWASCYKYRSRAN